MIAFQLIQQDLQTLDFGVEIGNTLRHGVADLDTGEEAKQISLQQLRVDHTASVGQCQIHAQRAQKGALARHVGSGNNRYFAQTLGSKIVANFVGIGQQWVAERLDLEDRLTVWIGRTGRNFIFVHWASIDSWKGIRWI